ncbi:transcription factor Pcc1-domain-containing protein [Collybia nuda]|uniref:Transcription factor Pcc1-domain-containing protein n=1 Tax=Collybia nuda TaxID=64659 RepID=A0A9P5XUD9_9AGAR|nr:transcription factor Pcc1-domain-containing protein [Collybia nuda]
MYASPFAATPHNVDTIDRIIGIPFGSNKQATIAKQAIEVDAELQTQAVKRTLEVKNEVLIASFSTLTIRLARLTVNGFLENVDLVVRTLESFGEEADKGPLKI